jgi:SAM-dependent methyltransferase
MIFNKFRTINSKSHNWLIHEIYIKSFLKYEHLIRGTVIDIGCGRKPYKDIITKKSERYIGLEYSKSIHGLNEVDVIGTALQIPFKNEISDIVISFQVMEHIAEPECFLKEIYRILKREGYCLLMTPFMWSEHEQPNDFFRYTRYGINYLAKKAGFEVVEINADTGFLVTVIIRFNYFLISLNSSFLKFLLKPIMWINQNVAKLLDRWFDKGRTFTSNYTTLLQKGK